MPCVVENFGAIFGGVRSLSPPAPFGCYTEAAKAECKFGMEVGCKTISLEELGQKRDLGQDMSGVKYYLGARFITEIKYK